jgi:hypothetical protein
VGARPLIEGLRTVHGAGLAFHAYWTNECTPVLNAGFRPPLIDGFEHFMRSKNIAEAITKHLDEELKGGTANPYDTHPPLKERIAAVSDLPAGEVSDNDPPAISLLAEVPELEHQLLVALASAEAAGKLKPIGWSDVCARVYLPQWTALAKANSASLQGITPDSLPERAADLKTLGKRFVGPGGQTADEEHAEVMAGMVVGSALMVLLTGRGGRLDGGPGDPISITLNSATITPFDLLRSLASGKVSGSDWQQRCLELGVAGIDLGDASLYSNTATQTEGPPVIAGNGGRA